MDFGMEFGENQEEPRNDANVRNGQEARGTAGIPGRDDDRKLFVGGLSRQTSERELKEHFTKFGDIDSVTVKVDPYTGLSRGFAFIVFSSPSTIDKLLTSGDHYINKRKVDPKRVSKKTQQGKIFVGGLTPEIGDTEIRDYFSKYGTIVEIQSPFDKVKNQRKGFCFITFESKDVVFELLKQPKQFIAGKEVDVRKVKVNPEAGPMMQGLGLGRGNVLGRGVGWAAPPPFAPYANSFASGYGGGYDNYEYPQSSYDDYTGGYEYEGSAQGGFGAGAKPRGGRPFQRHLPY